MADSRVSTDPDDRRTLPTSDHLGARHRRLRAALDERQLDAVIVNAASNIRYLSNHTGSAGLLVLTRDALHLLVDFRYRTAIDALQASPSAPPDLQVWPVPASYDEALLDCLRRIGVSRVGFEAAHLTVARYEWLAPRAQEAGIALQSTSGLVEASRIVKDAFEIALLRESAARLASVVEAALAAVRAGTEERVVAGEVEAAIRRAGYERLAFDTIVASGPNAALPHHRAGARTLSPGDLVVLDFGGVLDGYCCDLTRTVSIGPPSARMRDVYGAVLAAQQAAIAAVRPGVDATAVDAAARSVLEAHGLGEAFGHGTGHGLGLDVHEEPRVGRPRPDTPPVTLQSGMVFTVEPGAYLPGWGGVRIEDDVLVTATGCDILTSSPRALLAL